MERKHSHQEEEPLLVNADRRVEGVQLAKKPVPFWVVACILIVVQAGFGGYGIMVKKYAASAHANGVVFSFYRDALCFPVLLIAARVIEGVWKIPQHSADWLLFVGLGLTGMFGGQLAYILGIYFGGPDIASIMQPAMPVWASLFVIILGVERPPDLRTIRGWLKVFGILLAAGGAVAMSKSKGNNTEYSNQTLGAILSLSNTILFAMYVTIQKKYIFSPSGYCHARWSEFPIFVTAWSYGFGAVFMILGAILGGVCDVNATFNGNGCSNQNMSNPDQSNTDAWAYSCVAEDSTTGVCHLKTNTLQIPMLSIPPLVYAVFITSALNYGLITFANKHCSTSIVSAFWPLQVFVAVGVAFLVFKDTLVPLQIIGGAIIILGLACVIQSARLTDRYERTAHGE